MSATDRFVRHLRLQAGSEADVRSVLPRIEDALRCASLPDDGARLCVVRKLALGRIPRDISSQHLSRVIEQRVAEVGGQWVAGGTAAAAQANFVAFTSSLEARTQLALRLVRGEPLDAWYWPLAVPEFRATQSPVESIRQIFSALAQLPEARAALPAWSTSLVSLAGPTVLDMLAAAISEKLAESILQPLGIALPDTEIGPDMQEAWPARAPERAVQNGAIAGVPPVLSAPRWLRALLVAGRAQGYQLTEVPAARPARRRADARQATAARLTSDQRVAAVPYTADDSAPELAELKGADSAPISSQLDELAQTDARPQSTPRRHAQSVLAKEVSVKQDVPLATRAQPELLGAEAAFEISEGDVYPSHANTSSAGLLFLLPVLVRLGVLDWADEKGDAGEFVLRVLAAVLRRLRVSREDPAWQLLCLPGVQAEAMPLQTPAPGCWADSALRDPRRGSSVQLAAALSLAQSADEQAGIWLTAIRRCLRRTAGIGLASLVLRPGQISSTPTHIDMHFRMNDIDMRVRRLGLDIDPGWLPWLGKVVSYHYRKDAS